MAHVHLTPQLRSDTCPDCGEAMLPFGDGAICVECTPFDLAASLCVECQLAEATQGIHCEACHEVLFAEWVERQYAENHGITRQPDTTDIAKEGDAA